MLWGRGGVAVPGSEPPGWMWGGWSWVWASPLGRPGVQLSGCLCSTDTSINEGKQPQTLPQEPDPGADGLTYAELDGQVLQAKPGSPALPHEPAQPSMYPTINVSWGAPQ
ncbi:unnamed protein product [Caretta caretta]